MISSLRLINFKKFEDQLLEFKPLILISGLNSTGKSSVLQSLLLLRQSYQQNLINVAKEKMEALTQELNETSILAMIRNNKRVILHKVECNQMLTVNTLMVADIYNTSTGRLLMAYCSSEDLQNLIKSIGLPSIRNWPGANTKIGLEKELEKIRKAEFVQTVSIYHTVGFAVPIFQGKEVFTALSVFVPSSRYSDSYKTKILNLLNMTAKQISNNLQ
jgi:DNA-binding IclR family transcriptional regulator